MTSKKWCRLPVIRSDIMEPPPKRRRFEAPLTEDGEANEASANMIDTHVSTFKGSGVSNLHGTFNVGGNLSIYNHSSKQTSADVIRQAIFESLRFDQIDSRHQSIKRAYINTCEWFLRTERYKQWEEMGFLHGNNFLWIKGKPGAGKSTLMKYLHGEISKSNKDTLISFFFNARGHELEKSTAGLYRSFLWQLLNKNPNFVTG
jgi:hypothetical protein